jgi:DNA repair exonuclease SbcCD ATPase subunit
LQCALNSTSSNSTFAEFCPTETLNNGSKESSTQSVSPSNNIYDRSIAQFLDETRHKSDTVIMQLFATAAAEAFNQSNGSAGSAGPLSCNHTLEIDRLNAELQRQRAENEKIRSENSELRAKSSNTTATSTSDVCFVSFSDFSSYFHCIIVLYLLCWCLYQSTVAQLQSEIEALKFHIEQFEQYADQQQKMYDEAVVNAQTQATRISELEQVNMQQTQQIEALQHVPNTTSGQSNLDSNEWKSKFETCESELASKTTELGTMKSTLKELRKAMLESARAQQQLQQQIATLQSTASAPVPEVLPAPSVSIVATPTVQIAPSAPAPTYTTLNVNGTPIKVRDEVCNHFIRQVR